MITLPIYSSSGPCRDIHVNPAFVVSVSESGYRYSISYLRMADGKQYEIAASAERVRQILDGETSHE